MLNTMTNRQKKNEIRLNSMRRIERIGMTFARFMRIRRRQLNPACTNWDSFLADIDLEKLNVSPPKDKPDWKLTTISRDRVVGVKDPWADKWEGNDFQKLVVARALHFAGWWEMARAWDTGKHPTEFPTEKFVLISDDVVWTDPNP